MTRSTSRRRFLRDASLWTAAVAASRRLKAKGPMTGKYQATWDSLKQYRVPEWYLDAKFGIFLHWGVYSVPAHASEWYPRLMYRREDPVFEWHRRNWGPQSMFGYKDFIPMFRAQNWNPDTWADLFRRAGARYVVPVGEHHDGFPMYDCLFTPWTTVHMGPRRDVVGELGRAVRNQGLKLGVSSHRAFDWSYYTFADDFDTNNPRFSGLYGTPHQPTPLMSQEKGELRQTVPPDFLQDWFARTINLVDGYQPDLMWFDFGFEGPEFEPYRRQYAAYYYNRAEEWGKGVAINYKHNAFPTHAAVLDIERGLLNDVQPYFWQTDTSVGWKSWGYISDEEYKSASDLLPELIDIVSKNGCLLLNVGPKPDGTIPDEAQKTLLDLGRWLETNGESIYATRPWKTYGEGPNRLSGGQFGEKKGVHFTGADIRFTRTRDAIYAIALAWPGAELKVSSLGSNAGIPKEQIAGVTLLGIDHPLEWNQSPEALTVNTPAQKPEQIAYAFKISLKP